MDKPNILLIVVEHHRGDWTEFNSQLPIKTPNIKKYGEKGVFFTNAICPSPLCAPSRICLGTGRKYDNCDVLNNSSCYPLDHTSFYKLLQDEAGYHTMMCGKFDFNKPLYSWGRDGKQVVDGKDYMKLWGISDGIDNEGKWDAIIALRKGIHGPYMSYLEEKGLLGIHSEDFADRPYTNCAATPISDEDYCDNWIGRNALHLLENSPDDTPWYLQINFNGAHPPWDITTSMKDKCKNVEFPTSDTCTLYDKETLNTISQNYVAMIENIDRWMGDLVEYLKNKNQFDNTIIMLIGDHGEMLGDHNLTGKSKPYHPSVNVPLMIYGPSIKERGVVNGPVETLDLSATCLDYAGIKIPVYMDAKSIKNYLTGSENSLPREYVTSGLGNWRIEFDGKYKLVVGHVPKNSTRNKNKNKKKKRSPIRWLKRVLGLKKRANKLGKKVINMNAVMLFDLENDPHELTDIAKEHPEIVELMMEQMKKNLYS